jgi:NitT/TauT family transport system permease protein
MAVAGLLVAAPPLARLLAPYVAAANAVPKVVLAPLFVLWFGFGLESKVAFVASAIFFIVFYNLYVGVRSIDPLYLTNVRVLGASSLWQIRAVYIPAMVGWIAVSLRVSVGFALLGAVVAEFLGSNQGVGHLIALGQAALAPNEVLAGVLVIAFLAAIVDSGIVRLQERLVVWRPQ